MESRNEVLLGDICHVIGGGTPSKNKSVYYTGSIPWATVRDMKMDVISETEFQITKDAVRSSSTNVIPTGNVVIATRVGLGKVCLLERNTAINQDLRGIVPKRSGLVNPSYLFYWFKFVAPDIISAGTGATVQGVKVDFVKSLLIPLPPLLEQKRIVAILDELSTNTKLIVSNYKQKLNLFTELKQSILQKAFTGELTADQTAVDHTLLEAGV